MSPDVISYEALSSTILQCACKPRSVLFTGAGIGKKVGYPLWHEYLNGLADVCDDFNDSASAILMRKKIASGNLLGAAAVFEDCDMIPIGERLLRKAAPFKKPVENTQLEGLAPFFQLPFHAITTTNYDRSQHDAFAHTKHRAPLQLELTGCTLRGGADQTEFYIARIHGSSESPESMVLTKDSYANLERDQPYYKDFLLNLLRNRPCLFVGFSFVDPGIAAVLQVYQSLAGPTYPTLHCALIPADCPADLPAKLGELNIQALRYDPAEGHKSLWKAFRKAAAEYQKHGCHAKSSELPKPGAPRFMAFQKFLAFTYAQVKLAGEARPILEQACDGVVLALIGEGGEDGVDLKSLLIRIKETLHLDEKETVEIVDSAIGRLFKDHDISVQGDRYSAIAKEDNLLAISMEVLAKGVTDRVRVIENLIPDTRDRKLALATLERIFIVRSWDIGAHYAGGGLGYGDDLSAVLLDIIRELGDGVPETRRLALQRSCLDLLSSPTDDEAEHLAEVSRAAVSLQLVLSSPRQSLLHKYHLPQKVYFDASILLPALAPGHPFQSLYMGAIRRLRTAAKKAGIPCELCVGFPFLDEILSHKVRAHEIVREMGVGSADVIKRMIAFQGAENVNVFIGAYGGVLASAEITNKTPMSFDQFMRRFVPYSTNESLAKYLSQHGFRVEAMEFKSDHNSEYLLALNGLLAAYEGQKEDVIRGKEKILIQHEACQVVQLESDKRDGLRSIFVTNDRRLRRAAMNLGELRGCAGQMIPPDGFVGLVDIMVGIKPDKRGLARLVWASPRRTMDVALRDYLVRRALDEQDVACAKAAPDIINAIIVKAKEAEKREILDLTNANDAANVMETERFLDRFEKEFFEKMRNAIEKQDPNK